MEKELVSILIPVFNRVTIVGETIDSAIKQTYKNIEIIIVDNCSNDGTWELLQKYASKESRIHIFRNNENIGPVRNWKRCIDEAKGEYAKILFSDDLIAENFIEETIKVFDIQTAFVLSEITVFSNIRKIDLSKSKTETVFTTNNYMKDILLSNHYGFYGSPSCALFRTNDLKKSLQIDIPNPLNLDFNQFGAGNDLLLFLDTALRYQQIKVINYTTAFFRSHIGSISISNKLSVYYDFARYFFIKIHYPSYLSKFKAILWLRMKKSKQTNPVLKLIEKKINIFFLFQFIIQKILKQILTFF